MDVYTPNPPDRVESMSLEFGQRPCRLQCPYCYVRGPRIQSRSRREQRAALSVDELLNVVDQAVDLGLGGVGIIGPYEPLLEPGILDLAAGLRERGLRVTIFTKGTCITAEVAAILSRHDVTLGITVHAMNRDLHDALTGHRGSYDQMMLGLRTLLRNGYETKRHRILVQSVVARQNLRELPGIWRWAKRNGHVPFFERLTVQGAARRNLARLSVTPGDLRALFHRIAQVDREEFRESWLPHPPWIGQSCSRHLNGCHLTADGYVQPCTGVDIPVGNVRDVDLKSILRGSDVFWELRDIRHKVKGACHDCDCKDDCYGCRGQAYQLTGDYLAEDPCCWNNSHRCGSVCPVADDCLRAVRIDRSGVGTLSREEVGHGASGPEMSGSHPSGRGTL